MMKKYNDLTGAQKAIVLPLLKAARPVVQGETDNDYLTRLGQEELYRLAFKTWRLKKQADALQTLTDIS